MKTIQLSINLEYDDSLMHSGDSDTEAKEWFFNDILRGEKLSLFCGEIGDTIGTVRVASELAQRMDDMNNHQHINQAAGVTSNNESLEADGSITVYSLESGRVVAEYEGLEVHEAMAENGRLRERLAALEQLRQAVIDYFDTGDDVPLDNSLEQLLKAEATAEGTRRPFDVIRQRMDDMTEIKINTPDELREWLHSNGWESPNDAQWTRITPLWNELSALWEQVAALEHVYNAAEIVLDEIAVGSPKLPEVTWGAILNLRHTFEEAKATAEGGE